MQIGTIVGIVACATHELLKLHNPSTLIATAKACRFTRTHMRSVSSSRCSMIQSPELDGTTALQATWIELLRCCCINVSFADVWGHGLHLFLFATARTAVSALTAARMHKVGAAMLLARRLQRRNHEIYATLSRARSFMPALLLHDCDVPDACIECNDSFFATAFNCELNNRLGS